MEKVQESVGKLWYWNISIYITSDLQVLCRWKTMWCISKIRGLHPSGFSHYGSVQCSLLVCFFLWHKLFFLHTHTQTHTLASFLKTNRTEPARKRSPSETEISLRARIWLSAGEEMDSELSEHRTIRYLWPCSHVALKRIFCNSMAYQQRNNTGGLKGGFRGGVFFSPQVRCAWILAVKAHLDSLGWKRRQEARGCILLTVVTLHLFTLSPDNINIM